MGSYSRTPAAKWCQQLLVGRSTSTPRLRVKVQPPDETLSKFRRRCNGEVIIAEFYDAELHFARILCTAESSPSSSEYTNALSVSNTQKILDLEFPESGVCCKGAWPVVLWPNTAVENILGSYSTVFLRMSSLQHHYPSPCRISVYESQHTPQIGSATHRVIKRHMR